MSKTPSSSNSKRFKYCPYSLIIAETPVFADLITGKPSSIALARAAAKCCKGPYVFPYQASFVKFTKKLGLFPFITLPGKIIS